MRSFITVVLAIAGSFLAKDDDFNFKLKETVPPPRGWVEHNIPPPDYCISLRIGLPQPNFALLEQHLYEVSDPIHERYGQYLSKEEVEALVAPHQESLDSVNNWLASFGLQESKIQRSPANDWVKVVVPVSMAEKMLNTTYFIWKHLESDDYLVRTTSYSLPDFLHAHIDLVQPTTMFTRFKASRSTAVPIGATPAFQISDSPAFQIPTSPIDAGNGILVDPSCNATVTVNCLKQLYNATGYIGRGKGSIGVTGYLEQYANIQDLQSFYAEQRPDAVGSNFTFVSVAGGINNQSLEAAGPEANLDVQFAFGISHPIPATFYSTAGRGPFKPDLVTPKNDNEPYLDWLDFVLSHPNPPLVISTSYGEDEQTLPESFAKRACQGFAQLGAKGVSLLFASGDMGVGDSDPNPKTQKCITNDGRNVTRFLANFPPSCPFVTAVGGTASIPEVAAHSFLSGGGFSDYFARPPYQDKAVTSFLNALPKGTYDGLFDRSGRAYPDVSAQGDNFSMWIHGATRLIAGTSASTPAFAGFVALLNDARLSKGFPPLGFLNPLIYAHPEAFNDITIGNNPGCSTSGFNATKGWDPVTGFGSPNFGKLLDIVTRS